MNDEPENSPSFIDVFDPQRYYPICSSLIDALDSVSILRLSKTCRTLSPLRQFAVTQRWNVDRPLSQFVRTPRRLRQLMRFTKAIIAGSFVLQFFEGETWPNSGLDIFVPFSPAVTNLTLYFRDVEGYSSKLSKSLPWNGQFNGTGNFDIHTYTRDNRVVRLIILNTFTSAVKFLLRNVYGSAVMNFITFSKAYSIFPIATFIERRMYVLQECKESEDNALQKYERRGFEAVSMDSWMDTSSEIRELSSVRTIGDRHTWVIELDDPWEYPDADQFECTRFYCCPYFFLMEDACHKQDPLLNLNAAALRDRPRQFFKPWQVEEHSPRTSISIE